MDIKEVIIYFQFPTINTGFFPNNFLMAESVLSNRLYSISFGITFETRAGLKSNFIPSGGEWGGDDKLEYIGTLFKIKECFTKIYKICKSNSAALLHIKDDIPIVAEMAKIKTLDFPDVDIKVMVPYNQGMDEFKEGDFIYDENKKNEER